MKKKPAKNLFMEYIHHWYVILITLVLILPAYILLPFTVSFCTAKGFSPFWSGMVGVAVGGFVSTFAMLILNIKLASKGKPFALAVQFVLFDVLGTALYVISRILMN